MAYEVDEIKFLKEEGFDWWTTIKKVPLKLLDQDFGTEVPISDLIDSPPIEKPDDAGGASSSGKQDVPEPVKKLNLDSLKRKADAVKGTGYSKVKFGEDDSKKEYFEVEVCFKQFPHQTFKAKLEKGFLVVGANVESTEGDGTVWRKFERRYMLPHDCYLSNLKRQVTAEYIETGLKINILKRDPDHPRVHPAIRPAGSPLDAASPIKSPLRETQSPHKTPPREKQGPHTLKTPPKGKQGPHALRSPPKEKQEPHTLKTPPKEKQEPHTLKTPPKGKQEPHTLDSAKGIVRDVK